MPYESKESRKFFPVVPFLESEERGTEQAFPVYRRLKPPRSDKARYVPLGVIAGVAEGQAACLLWAWQQGCAVQALWGVEGAGAHSCAAPAGAGLGLASAAQAGGVCLDRTSPNDARSAWRTRKSRP